MRAARIISLPVCLLLVAIVAPAAVGRQTPQPPPLPPARLVPGINAKDPFPGGCVDCHVIQPQLNVDGRLSTHMAQLATEVGPDLLAKAQAASPAGLKLRGKHPAIPAAVLKNIPKGCMPCHANTSRTAPPFASLLHGIHLHALPQARREDRSLVDPKRTGAIVASPFRVRSVNVPWALFKARGAPPPLASRASRDGLRPCRGTDRRGAVRVRYFDSPSSRHTMTRPMKAKTSSRAAVNQPPSANGSRR